MALGVFLIGLFVGMGGSGAIALAALTYPTAIRSTGVGWAMGVGRFAQVLTPLFAGIVTGAGWSSVQLFVVLAILPVLAALAIIVLRTLPAHRRSRGDDERAGRRRVVGESYEALRGAGACANKASVCRAIMSSSLVGTT